jgi:hypothetical protein
MEFIRTTVGFTICDGIGLGEEESKSNAMTERKTPDPTQKIAGD